jgi:hypothetical protein
MDGFFMVLLRCNWNRSYARRSQKPGFFA